MYGYKNIKMNLSRELPDEFLGSGLGPMAILSKTKATPHIYESETATNFTVIERVYKYDQDSFR